MLEPMRARWSLLPALGVVACASAPPTPTLDATLDATADLSLGEDALATDALDAPYALDASLEGAAPDARLGVLVYTRTTGFRHGSIPAAVSALRALGAQRGWSVEATEDPAAFTPAHLGAQRVVAFVHTSGDVLDDAGRAALQGYLRGGGGFVGVHAATDTEYSWPFYGALVGAWFLRHPPGVPAALLRVEDPAHPATAALGPTWSRSDEWYTFREDPSAQRPLLHSLLAVDEDSYGAAPEFRMGHHPVAWYQHVAGGRSFYTALGHTEESWSEPAFLTHLAGGVEWAAGVPSEQVLLDEFNGTSPNGVWEPHGFQGAPFPFEVARDALRMTVVGPVNQHLTRRGLLLDAARPYAVDALFTIPSRNARGIDVGLRSFCLNFAVQGQGGSSDDLQHLYAWSLNLDLGTNPPATGMMKHMGFVDGVFAQVGQTPVQCCTFDTEYRLRVEVHRDLAGRTRTGWVTATLTEGLAERARFEVDYGAFPWQPDRSQPLRLGVNTHGADWVLRDLRVRALR